MAKGKAARSRAAKVARSAAEEEREDYIAAWLSQLERATVPTLDSNKVRALATKSMRTNPHVAVTEELVETVVGLIVDAWRGPGDSDWWKGSIDIEEGAVSYNRFTNKRRK